MKTITMTAKTHEDDDANEGHGDNDNCPDLHENHHGKDFVTYYDLHYHDGAEEDNNYHDDGYHGCCSHYNQKNEQ